MKIKLRGLPQASTLLVLAVLLAGCGAEKKPEAGAQRSAPEVGIVTIATSSQQIERELSGRTSPFRVAEIRPQVGGIVEKRLFTEGSNVKAGQLLYQINSAAYQAQYDSAKANVDRAAASLGTLKLKAERYQQLVSINGVSKQEFDDAMATKQQAQADVAAARAAMESAKINLGYSRIVSPISGVIGRSAVTEGALLSVGQPTALATVQQLDKIYVDISQSSAELLRLKREFGSLTDQSGIPVSIILEDGSVYKEQGKLEFTGVTVDAGTGSVSLRVLVPNPQQDLLPGMFVRARLEQAQVKDAILVPQQAVSRTPKGEATVMIVGAEDKVEVRGITANRTIGSNWLVTKGLKSGDRVIVEGLQKIKPGIAVKTIAAKLSTPIPSTNTQAANPASAVSAVASATAAAD